MSELLAHNCSLYYPEGGCKSYLVDYLNDYSSILGDLYQTNPINDLKGYFTLDTLDDMCQCAYAVFNTGVIDTSSVGEASLYGVRPVINVKF
jgi:hypothetical protein